jgi:hypothetical protein
MPERDGCRGRKRHLAVRTEMLRMGFPNPMEAQTLDEFLKLNPQLAIESSEDAKCKALLGELGMLEHFTRSNEPELSALTFRNHPTHWIVGMRWSGYPKPKQNGYKVVCIPKPHVTEEGVKDFVQYVMETNGACVQQNGIIRLPPDWRKRN